MKKILILFICILGISSCMKKEDLFDPDRVQEEAKKNFPVQDVDPDHDWNMMGIAAISVSLNQGTGETYTIKVYTADPFDETSNATLSKKVSLQDGKSSILSVDLPKALEYVYVVREDSMYNRSMKPVKLIDGKGEVNFGVQTQKRSLSSRSVTGVTYPDVLSNASVEAAFKTPTADELKKMTSFDYNKLWGANVKTYKLDGEDKTKAIDLGGIDGLTLYVTADIDLTSFALGRNTKIHILNEGSLSVPSLTMQEGAMLAVHEGGEFNIKSTLNLSNATLYNRGEITSRTGSAQVNLTDNAYIYNDGDFLDDSKANLKISNTTSFFVNAGNGEMDIDNLSLYSGGTFVNESGGDVEVKGRTSVDGVWVNDGSYETSIFYYTGQNYLVRNDCKLVVVDEFLMQTSSGAKFLMNGSSTMYCKQMFLDQATIELGSKAFIKVTNNIHFTDGNRIEGTGNDFALLYVEQNNVANANPKQPIVYSGNLKIAGSHKFPPLLEGNAEIISKEQVNITGSSDCATGFDTEGGGTEPEDKVSVYTFAFEDSSTSGGDYDFNDVVLKVETVPTNGKLKVKLVAAGATKDLQVFFGGNVLFNGQEVHAAMGCPSGVMINTGSVKGTVAEDVVSWPDGYTLKKEGNFYIYDVKAKLPVKLPLFIDGFTEGDIPYGIVVPVDWDYPTEGQKVNNKYPKFTEWAQNALEEPEWYK